MRRRTARAVPAVVLALLPAVLLASAGPGSAQSAAAATTLDAVPTVLVVQAPPAAFTTDDVPVTATLTLKGGEPVPDATVRIERTTPDDQPVSWEVTTGADGTAEVTDSFAAPADATYSAGFDGTAELAGTIAASTSVHVDRRSTGLTLAAPAQAAVDEAFWLSGTLTGPPSPAEVTVTGPEGFHAVVQTDAAGDFELPAAAHVGGDNVYTASFAATSQYAIATATVTVTSPRKASGFVLDPIAPAVIGSPATISGVLAGTDRPVLLEAARTADGPAVTTALTDATGAFSLPFWPDQPSTPTAVPVYLRFAGNARNTGSSAQAAIAYLARPISLAVHAPSGVEIGLPFTVSGDLGGLLGATSVRVAPSNGPARTVPVAAGGHFAVTVPASYVTGTVSVTVRTGGTGTPYIARSKTVQVAVKIRPELRLRTVAPRSVRRGIATYRLGDDPLFVTGTAASLPGLCHRYRVQRFSDGGWRTVRTSTCIRLNRTYAETRWRWRSGMVRGVTYRVFSTVAASSRTFAGSSPARLVRFR